MAGMRIRRQSKEREEKSVPEKAAGIKSEPVKDDEENGKGAPGREETVKVATPVNAFRPMDMVKRVISNPNFNMQVLLILMTLSSEDMRMDRKLDNMSVTMEKLRNINEVITSSMQSLKMITEVPKNVRKILE